VRGIIEKPTIEQAPSNLTTVGRFVVTPYLIDVLDRTPPGRSGEVWLMDAFDTLSREEPVHAYQYIGERFDCGQPLGILKASLRVASQRPDLADNVLDYAAALTSGRS
jgi:UTP--glucose-1-phosphate uridylyltransferase